MGFCKSGSPKEALHAAVRNMRLETVESLLANGAAVNHSGKEHGETPMYAAAAGGDVTVAMILQRYGADLEKPCFEGGRTPLHVACQYGHIEMVSWLMCIGANAEAATTRDFKPLSGPKVVPEGTTPLELARLSGRGEVVALLETGAWRLERRLELVKLRKLREEGRAFLAPVAPQEPDQEPEPDNYDYPGRLPWEVATHKPIKKPFSAGDAECIDMLLTLGKEVGPHTSDGILRMVLDYADW